MVEDTSPRKSVKRPAPLDAENMLKNPLRASNTMDNSAASRRSSKRGKNKARASVDSQGSTPKQKNLNELIMKNKEIVRQNEA